MIACRNEVIFVDKPQLTELVSGREACFAVPLRAKGETIGSLAGFFDLDGDGRSDLQTIDLTNDLRWMYGTSYLSEDAAADRLENAVAQVIAEGRDVTYDLKPRPDDPTAVGTSQVADAIIRQMAS